MANLSTEQVAQKVGIGRATLERWLASGKLKRPRTIRFGKSEFRDWTDHDIEQILRFKEKNYRKGRGRKPKTQSRV